MNTNILKSLSIESLKTKLNIKPSFGQLNSYIQIAPFSNNLQNTTNLIQKTINEMEGVKGNLSELNSGIRFLIKNKQNQLVYSIFNDIVSHNLSPENTVDFDLFIATNLALHADTVGGYLGLNYEHSHVKDTSEMLQFLEDFSITHSQEYKLTETIRQLETTLQENVIIEYLSFIVRRPNFKTDIKENLLKSRDFHKMEDIYKSVSLMNRLDINLPNKTTETKRNKI